MKRAKPMRPLCRLAQVSRAGFYRWRKRPAKPADADVEVRDAIQRIALEFPCYGTRRVAFELERRGYRVNRKRVQRLMREDNLLCLRRRKFVVTTDSHHNFPVYPNLAATLEVSSVNQLWIADLTYIRLAEEFMFLAAILDAYSRRVIGWALDRTLDDELTLTALRMAIACRAPSPGLVHHSDRGCSTPAGTISGCCRRTRAASACRAAAIPTTTQPASRS